MADERISFKGFDIPGLVAGEHLISTSVTVDAPGIGSTEFKASALNLLVSGPRYILSPKEIYAVFPPRDGFGEFDSVLPHIELEPASLPWIRTSGNSDPQTPWLALILLQEDESSDNTKISIENKPWIEYRNLVELHIEVTDEAAKDEKPLPPVKVLNIEAAFLNKIMPSAGDVKWCSHVRVGQNTEGQAVERAVLVCNRMPRAGARAAVHLVSLEGRLKSTGELDYDLGQNNGKVPLLSLHSWEFACPDDEQFEINDKTYNRLDDDLKARVDLEIGKTESLLQKEVRYRGKSQLVAALTAFNDQDKDRLINTCHLQTETFKGLMDALDLRWMNLPKPKGSHEAAGKFFDIGSVPMAHGLRQGGKTVSWYRGPLIADKTLSEDMAQKLLDTLPIRFADHLLMYNAETGMLDTTYAAAWELGRLMSVSEPRVSQQIAQWKTSHAREVALAEQNLAFSHIPFTDSSFVHAQGGPLEDKLQQYFVDLHLLKGIPFHYLVPHKSYLPDESMRFFYIDPLWMDCLLDGAFSIGRVSQYDQDREKSAGHTPLSAIQSGRPPLTGILLRSDLVSGWPSLMVEAFRKEEPLACVRFDRLGPNVLIAIFNDEMDTLKLHLPPESLHFGFSRSSAEGGAYFKELKHLDTGKEIPDGRGGSLSCLLEFRNEAPQLRVMNIEKLIENINNAIKAIENKENGKDVLQYTDPYSGVLAIQLIEGVPSLEVKVP